MPPSIEDKEEAKKKIMSAARKLAARQKLKWMEITADQRKEFVSQARAQAESAGVGTSPR